MSLAVLAFNTLGAQRIPGTWAEKAAMGSGRFWAFSFALGDKVYGGTGRPQFSATTPLQDFWEYDPATDVWTQKADYPGGPREGATGFVAAGRGFAAFGTPFIQFSRAVYEYLPDSNAWVPRANVPGIGFAFSHGFVLDSTFYIGPENGTNQVYAYHVPTDTWDTVAPFPGNDRRAQVSFAVQGKGYIGMGAGVFGGVYGDFWAYDPTANSWAQVAELFPKSDQSTAFAIGDYGYVLNVGGNQKNTYRYDPVLDQWEFEATLPGDRIANGTTCANDSLGFLLFGERTISGGNFGNDRAYVFTPGTDGGTNTAISPSLAALPLFDLRADGQGGLWVDVAAGSVAGPLRIALVDISGKSYLQRTGQAPGQTWLPVQDLPTGLYLVQVARPGQPVQTRKWLKR